MRGFHQSGEVSALSEKAEYMSATAPSLVILNIHLAKGERSIPLDPALIDALFRWGEIGRHPGHELRELLVIHYHVPLLLAEIL